MYAYINTVSEYLTWYKFKGIDFNDFLTNILHTYTHIHKLINLTYYIHKLINLTYLHIHINRHVNKLLFEVKIGKQKMGMEGGELLIIFKF